MLSAFLRLVRADYLSPMPPPMRPASVRHIMAYVNSLWDPAPAYSASSSIGGGGSSRRRKGSSGGGSPPPPPAMRPEVEDARAGRPLARAVQLYFCAYALHGMEAFWAARDAADILADSVCQPLVAAELEELEALAALGTPAAADGQPPQQQLLTMVQLQHACHCLTLAMTCILLEPQGAAAAAAAAAAAGCTPLTAAGRRETQAAALASADALIALEPANPKSWALAATADGLNQQPAGQQMPVECSLKAVQLAREQGRPYWVAKAGDLALVLSLGTIPGTLALGQATAAAVLAAFEEAGPALHRCKHLLPQVGPAGSAGLLGSRVWWAGGPPATAAAALPLLLTGGAFQVLLLPLRLRLVSPPTAACGSFHPFTQCRPG